MSRGLGVALQNSGMIIIVTVMLIDRFLFQIQDGFIFICACVGTILLGAGILILKKYDMKEKFSNENNINK